MANSCGDYVVTIEKTERSGHRGLLQLLEWQFAYSHCHGEIHAWQIWSIGRDTYSFFQKEPRLLCSGKHHRLGFCDMLSCMLVCFLTCRDNVTLNYTYCTAIPIIGCSVNTYTHCLMTKYITICDSWCGIWCTASIPTSCHIDRWRIPDWFQWNKLS